MDISIIEEKNNTLLNRKELKFNVTFEGPTPARNDVKSKLAAMLNVPIELLIVQGMRNMFGKQELSGYARVYEDASRMKEVEKGYSLKRNEVPQKEASTEE